MVRNLLTTGVTVLLTTQYLEEADQLADEIAVVDHGRVIATGTPEELKNKTAAQTLEVRPANPDLVDQVVAIVAGIVRNQPEVQNTTVSVMVTDPSVLPVLVRQLDEAGVAVAELALRSASLDEVFLSLTGHPAEDGDTDDGFADDGSADKRVTSPAGRPRSGADDNRRAQR
jgi:oleandomycin transport system ATP-binding protein